MSEILTDNGFLTDPIALTQRLIRCASVTPADDGAMNLVQTWLEALGFEIHRLKFGEIENLYACRGTNGPNLCFAGHTDVVPAGAQAQWQAEPFAGEIRDGVLIGRGAVDMKGAIAAWIAALARQGPLYGRHALLITGDEEGVAIDGTRKVVDWLEKRGETLSHCIVGEPSSATRLGDMIKVGRRGSLNAVITVTGKHGHVAYPERANNPLTTMLALLSAYKGQSLDSGYQSFPPTNLEITTIDSGNPTTNLIPQSCTARLNIRFNPNHTGASLSQWLQGIARDHAAATQAIINIDISISGEAFLTESGAFTETLSSVIETQLGVKPEASTSGGTSDARFIRALCPVVEFGLVGQTMHQVNEAVAVTDLEALTQTYEAFIKAYFASSDCVS